uniref:Uncharacterized protein n=1 Tax=viral metagenome TaxID=1070528 RepID=A0A6C0CYJ9_9ZZZZ
MNVIKGIEFIIKNAIEQYACKIADKYDNIELGELEDLWNEISEDIKISISVNSKQSKSKSKIKTEEVHVDTKKTTNSGCQYVFSRGQNSGETCGSKTVINTVYCSRHKKQEGKEPKTKKIIPTVDKTVKPVLTKHKIINKLWHQETGLVFDTIKDEKIVIGKVLDNKVISLTAEDVETCKNWRFKYDSTVLEDSKTKKVTQKEIEKLQQKSIEDVLKTIKVQKNNEVSEDEDYEIEDD